ncbi:agamous-like MADS-box protein AGL80 [Phalaenopsis equestris]|uniref:agamous-like MADS-box protein AGL80 n=1 Tax=Phalaenopsis equestris TaxID=78828 RepID=UPI0009E478E6|nr:agamous-like MADS-box protein AGL80 [Phalaenopsis equestris]
MARKKVTLAYITNDATRRATLKKRRRGLLKKVNELSILCGVSACAVVYSPQSDQPEVFPSSEEAKRILTELADLPEIDKNKKMVNQRTFLEQRLMKLSQQARRLEHENKELSTAVCLRQCLAGRSVESLSKEEAEDLLDLVDRKAKALQVRMHQLGPLMLPPVVDDVDVREMVSYDGAAIEAMRQYEWIQGGGGGVLLANRFI